jgi:hypothetical protein
MRQSLVLTLMLAACNALPQRHHGTYLSHLTYSNLPRIGGRPEIIVEAPRPLVVGYPRPNVIIERPRPNVIVERPRPNVIVEQPRPNVIGGLGGLVAGLGSALGSILTTDTDASQPDAPAQ